MSTKGISSRSIMFIAVLLTIVIVAAVIAGSSRVLAQDDAPDGPVNTSADSTGSSDGEGLTTVDVPMTAVQSGEGLPEQPGGSNGWLAEDPLALDSINATFSYFRLLGPNFDPRNSGTSYAYDANGCIYLTGGSDLRVVAPLLIPDGSLIKYLRLYYKDTNASTNIESWITRYQPGIANADVAYVSSTGNAGYGTELSEEVTHTVDLTGWAYVVIITPNTAASSNAYCGVRVAYYAPTFAAAALPVISKNHSVP